ncbi:putrescine hydroxycinnamoyltransferase 2 [Zea mays]|jgi:shikimate O-hydroxycinnamoyltransferase|uniref:Uncharacterized protein n=1 Tax=Zea mays TaxID=4577 RepID=A0A804N4R3_MAIZE|nr:putrescine hydroxycinnamoyltransferase 2 [Zea mays]|eukprot:XP_020406704.1 putrescine hydroxycinnamoyltransferase 2 [Zea mays]
MTKMEVVETAMVVTPSEEMRRQGLWLSNLDLQSPHIYTTVLNYYPAPAGRPEHGGGACDPERLKVALARALVPFYPLAGRLCLGEDGRRYVDCNGEGVRFFVARADVTGPELFKDYQPSPEVTETFVPDMPPEELPCMVALFQLTFLKCGGVVLSSSFHHAVVDGTSLFHFMQSWSRLARGLDAAEAVGPQAPFHDRTSLRARAPPLQQMGAPPAPAAHSLNFAATSCPRAFVARVYPFPHTLVHELTSRCCGSGATGVSRFAAVTAQSGAACASLGGWHRPPTPTWA